MNLNGVHSVTIHGTAVEAGEDSGEKTDDAQILPIAFAVGIDSVFNSAAGI